MTPIPPIRTNFSRRLDVFNHNPGKAVNRSEAEMAAQACLNPCGKFVSVLLGWVDLNGCILILG
jgi:hypothetical protein